MENYTLTDTNSPEYSILGNIIVWGLIIGTLLSYTPQYYKIVKEDSTEGISEWTIIFGIYSSLFNILGTIQENYNNIIDCKTNSNCYTTLIPIIQLFAPYLCISMLYIFYIKYYTIEFSTLTYYSNIVSKEKIKLRGLFHLFINIMIALILFYLNSRLTFHSLNQCGNILNIFSSILSGIMWLPQMYTTYKLKKDEALSILALCIHSFGCLVTIIYQIGFAHQRFFVILNYLIGGLCELSIVIMIYYFRHINKNNINRSSLMFENDYHGMQL